MSELQPVLAQRFVVISSDPTTYFALVLGVLGIQLLVWSIARDNTDTDWWRAALLALVSVVIGALAFTMVISGKFSILAGIVAVLGSAFIIWQLCGWLYEELENWQRATMALGGAAIGVLAKLLGVLLTALIIGSAGG